ncbi:efflux RND transporter periplasmic adaptor subunit [Sediminibacterium soli]|uniref:efflux RND transporter periplasmic adaptor subunit n=1 Tax=Sediminibacterium soli TaxID=2698829 RepID=UPI001379B959|nr:efflux RND transporter periplasmic adaptor subunit [Sediminibacterium soli]NCI46193.1 efflux RND transporter periplasmic adaptor subunit [Sediminibacterium soli]
MQQSMVRNGLYIGSLLFLAACGGAKQETPKAPPPTPVTVYEVRKERAVYFDEYPATIAALNQVDLKAQVTGYVTGVYFTDGQHVRKGQKLYDIDRQQYQASYDQAVANLNVAKSNLAKIQQDADRYTDLLKQDAIAKQRVDYALADLQSAKMQVAAAQANVSRLSNDIRFAAIYAPFDGTIGISQAKAGTLVTANQNVLNTVSTDNPMAVDIFVDQKEIPRFTQLFRNPGGAGDSTFTLLLPGNIPYRSTGHISLLDRAVDPQTGTIRTRLVFPNNGQLKPGMSTSVQVRNNQAGEFLLTPNKALVEQMGEFFVFVLTDSSKVTQKKVTTGARIGDKVIVKDGLQPGEKVVTEGVQKLKEGTVVTTGTQPAKKP